MSAERERGRYMLIDSELLKVRLNEIDEIYAKHGMCSGMPSYSVFKSIIEAIERETKEKDGK